MKIFKGLVALGCGLWVFLFIVVFLFAALLVLGGLCV